MSKHPADYDGDEWIPTRMLCSKCAGPYPNKSTGMCYECMDAAGMITKNPCGEIPLPEYEVIKIAKNPNYQSMPLMYPTLGTRGKPLSADDMDYLKKNYASLDQLGKSTSRPPYKVVEISKLDTTRPCSFSDAMDPHCTVKSTIRVGLECLCDKHGQVRIYEYAHKLLTEEGAQNILLTIQK